MSTPMGGPGALPPIDEVTAPWWDATRERVLAVQHCADCETAQHPPRAVCLRCGGDRALELRPDAGDGVVDSCTVVERAVPGREPPYVVARIRLGCGVLMLSNVVTDRPHDIGVGDPVVLAWRELADGRALPVFEPKQRS